MRYLNANYLYSLWVVLRALPQLTAEESFEPQVALNKTMACLEAAAGRPRQTFDELDLHPEFFSKVAAVGHGIAAGHCFGNGNKRTAFLAMLQMMHVNGWTWAAPPDIIAFVMLRTASNVSGMDVREVAAFIGAYAVELTGKELDSYRHMSDGMVNNRLAEISEPEEFPARVTIPQEVYQTESVAALKKHVDLMVGEEAEEFQRTFRWPEEMDNKIRRVYRKMRYHQRIRRWYSQGRRKKRFGKRRCPHLGGRSVPRRS